jgi:hypothetical protein
MISEAQGNILSIQPSDLRHVIWQQSTLKVFRLLLAMSFKDLPTAYQILTWIIEQEPLASRVRQVVCSTHLSS